MSRRLGAAMVDHIRRMPGRSLFVLIEGVPTSLAEGVSLAWDTSLPPLKVASSSPARFAEHALTHGSGTAMRNTRDANGQARGVVLVFCEGEQAPDRQSLNLFESVAPGDLLNDPEGVALIAQQQPAVLLNGPTRAVREAVNRADISSRPSAAQVASYFDRVASGEDPLAGLPALGAFQDQAAVAAHVDSDRIGDNLALAARRTSEDVLRPAAYADLRRRAELVLGRRPGLAVAGAARSEADQVMALLQAGSDDLLTRLQYDEAREILEQRTRDLTHTVLEELRTYERGLDPDSQAAGLPWRDYAKAAEDLRRSAAKREAAAQLCDADDAQQRRLFSRKTRTKLERLQRDKAVDGSRPSCPEAALARAAQQLGGPIERVQLLEPRPSATSNRANRSGAGRILTLACAQLRLGALMRRWRDNGREVDGLLLQPADNEEDLLSAFTDADAASSSGLPPLQLRLHGDDGSTVQVNWKPDLDDVAVLRTCLLFAERPSLTLSFPGEPTLSAYCTSATAPAALTPRAELLSLAAQLQTLAVDLLKRGLDPAPLQGWAEKWTEVCQAQEKAGQTVTAEALTLAGTVRGGGEAGRAVALTPLAPLKAEWLAQYLQALWDLLDRAEREEAEREPVASTAGAVARTTASHHPAHLRLSTSDDARLPTSEGRIWGLYGGDANRDDSGHAVAALSAVLTRLLALQPEAAGHLRCLAWGPGAADLLVRQAVTIIGKKIGRARINKVEVFCVGAGQRDRPAWETLLWADEELRGSRHELELRYLTTLDEAQRLLKPVVGKAPAVHLALVTGLTNGGGKLKQETAEVDPPAHGDEVLFAPRVWQRPRQDRRTLLMPPAATPTGLAWLRLQNAVGEEGWPERGMQLRVPEVRTGSLDVAAHLRQIHDLALWVATMDRYATRDSLEQALGRSQVAILHQERRLGGDSPLSLVLSQKSGGPTDRAIGRSLRAAGIVGDLDAAMDIGTRMRQVASQGYGILALQAATSGAGINELVGHVVAFSLLATTTTPWPLPPGCRVLLVSLDQYRHWFSSKRADLLAIALDPAGGGVHVAAIEVKARRSDEIDAASGALDQLTQTLSATRWAADPGEGSIYSRLWLNRLTEAAYAVARESRFKLDADELAALEAFRRGHGTLEWAGVGLVFGPHVQESQRHYPQRLGSDIVPVAMHNVRLTEKLLRDATFVELTKLRTVEATAPPLEGGRTRRRPEARPHVSAATVTTSAAGPSLAASAPQGAEDDSEAADALNAAVTGAAPGGSSAAADAGLIGTPTVDGATPPSQADSTPSSPPLGASSTRPAAQQDEQSDARPRVTVAADSANEPALGEFRSPLLGRDAVTGEDVRWHPAGPGKDDPVNGQLKNGHMEIWGSSGMGKTQFVMALLGQLSHQSGSRFGIADFKNDYSSDTGFPVLAAAEYVDLWFEGAPYNPLALARDEPRAVDTAVIELRDTVEEAARAYTRMGHRQKRKLETALRGAYESMRSEGHWPTLRTLDDHLDEDLAGVMGDLTRHDLFRAGPPLGDVVNRNVVFGLHGIPGNGQTTVLAAGFILSALLLKVQALPPVPDTVRYLVVVDEAHRVADFKAVKTMIKEGRSKGLAVVLATQQPLDLPDEVAANAHTKICFGLPDATVATMAARKLQQGTPRLAEQIRTLAAGEALVSFRGAPPRLLHMVQAYRDAPSLGLPPVGG